MEFATSHLFVTSTRSKHIQNCLKVNFEMQIIFRLKVYTDGNVLIHLKLLQYNKAIVCFMIYIIEMGCFFYS